MATSKGWKRALITGIALDRCQVNLMLDGLYNQTMWTQLLSPEMGLLPTHALLPVGFLFSPANAHSPLSHANSPISGCCLPVATAYSPIMQAKSPVHGSIPMKQEYDDSYHGTWSRLTLLLKTQDLNGAIFPNGSFMGSPVPREILDISPYTGFVDDSYPELLDNRLLSCSNTRSIPRTPQPNSSGHELSCLRPQAQSTPFSNWDHVVEPPQDVVIMHYPQPHHHAQYPEFPSSVSTPVSSMCLTPVPLEHYTPVSPHASNPHPSSVTNMVFNN